MAIIDCEDNDYYPTENIILADQRKRYDIEIHSQHWQLRALTGLASDNVLCFPGGHNHSQIHTLNLHTSERFALNKLTFTPRCLTAGNGWVCCGGESGEFSAVQIGPSDLPKDGDLDYSSTRLVQSSGVTPKSARFAKDRVNCVTMWFPPSQRTGSFPKLQQHPFAYTEPVAVLANNDRTVAVVSLRGFSESSSPQAICHLKYPDFVNRAVISPDGQLLAAVLDDPYLYIHRRVENDEWKPQDRPNLRYTWELQDTLLLKGQFSGDKTDQRGSFALSFSPTGQYLAVGTQHGVVSVYNVDKLCVPGEDALIKTFNSSRPGNTCGAIRDMAFCPGHYGLLAWTEDRGRVGIADVNSNFYRRQIIDLRESNTFEDQDLIDRSQISFSTLSIAQHTELLTRAFRRFHARNSHEEEYMREADLLRRYLQESYHLEDETLVNDLADPAGHALHHERSQRLRNDEDGHDIEGTQRLRYTPGAAFHDSIHLESSALDSGLPSRSHSTQRDVSLWQRNLARGGMVATHQGNGVYRITYAHDAPQSGYRDAPILRRATSLSSSSSPTRENTAGLVWSSDGGIL
ncbi:hypothetical protein TD95_001457 [Thielaviopsis punctulata]|uniref:DUF2415 domain-containing protein n=1 Tax=Thielaviopsis punctulata TaxID=72032 RepID=A0A0F4ZB98_9PEZI|nr:hypothetical protein TD95_001457 [Thielaviopsis punctulata]